MESIKLNTSVINIYSETGDEAAGYAETSEDRHVVSVDFTKNPRYDRVNSFISAVIKFYKLQNWRELYENNYKLKFYLCSSENIENIRIEVRSTEYPFIIVNEKIETSENNEFYVIDLNNDSVDEEVWEKISEICFVVTPQYITGNRGRFIIENIKLEK